VKELKSPRGEILLLPKWRRDAAILKHREGFARCGGRLKELFEKSSSLLAGIESFKNFPLLLTFIKMEISEPSARKITTLLHFSLLPFTYNKKDRRSGLFCCISRA